MPTSPLVHYFETEAPSNLITEAVSDLWQPDALGIIVVKGFVDADFAAQIRTINLDRTQDSRGERAFLKATKATRIGLAILEGTGMLGQTSRIDNVQRDIHAPEPWKEIRAAHASVDTSDSCFGVFYSLTLGDSLKIRVSETATGKAIREAVLEPLDLAIVRGRHSYKIKPTSANPKDIALIASSYPKPQDGPRLTSRPHTVSPAWRARTPRDDSQRREYERARRERRQTASK